MILCVHCNAVALRYIRPIAFLFISHRLARLLIAFFFLLIYNWIVFDFDVFRWSNEWNKNPPFAVSLFSKCNFLALAATNGVACHLHIDNARIYHIFVNSFSLTFLQWKNVNEAPKQFDLKFNRKLMCWLIVCSFVSFSLVLANFSFRKLYAQLRSWFVGQAALNRYTQTHTILSHSPRSANSVCVMVLKWISPKTKRKKVALNFQRIYQKISEKKGEIHFSPSSFPDIVKHEQLVWCAEILINARLMCALSEMRGQRNEIRYRCECRVFAGIAIR